MKKIILALAISLTVSTSFAKPVNTVLPDPILMYLICAKAGDIADGYGRAHIMDKGSIKMSQEGVELWDKYTQLAREEVEAQKISASDLVKKVNLVEKYVEEWDFSNLEAQMKICKLALDASPDI